MSQVDRHLQSALDLHQEFAGYKNRSKTRYAQAIKKLARRVLRRAGKASLREMPSQAPPASKP